MLTRRGTGALLLYLHDSHDTASAILDYPQFPQVHPQPLSGPNPVWAAQSVGLLEIAVDNLASARTADQQGDGRRV